MSFTYNLVPGDSGAFECGPLMDIVASVAFPTNLRNASLLVAQCTNKAGPCEGAS